MTSEQRETLELLADFLEEDAALMKVSGLLDLAGISADQAAAVRAALAEIDELREKLDDLAQSQADRNLLG